MNIPKISTHTVCESSASNTNCIHVHLSQAIWNWMDNYPEEFTDLQKRPNEELQGECLHDLLIPRDGLCP